MSKVFAEIEYINFIIYLGKCSLIVLVGGGQDRPCDAIFSEKCPYSHHNNTAFIKQPPPNTIKEYLPQYY